MARMSQREQAVYAAAWLAMLDQFPPATTTSHEQLRTRTVSLCISCLKEAVITTYGVAGWSAVTRYGLDATTRTEG